MGMDFEYHKLGLKNFDKTRSRPLIGLAIAAVVVCVLTFASLIGQPVHLSSLSGQESVLDGPTWFIWTSSAAHLRQRRDIIRSTWQTYYTNISYDARFVMGTPPSPWAPLIAHENATYGDIIVLDSAEDNKYWSVTEKPFETFILLRDRMLAGVGKRYDFVSKVDDDSFIDASTFYTDYLVPNRHTNRTIISRVVQYQRLHPFPHGSFYTLTWDLVSLIADLYRSDTRDLFEIMNLENPPKPEGFVKDPDVPARKFVKRHEDYMISDLLVNANEEFSYIRLEGNRAFDFTEQNVTRGTVNVHAMKEDEQYMWVASMYNSTGFAGTVDENGVDLQGKLIRTYDKGG